MKWTTSEFCWVNGYKCVYTAKKGNVSEVHLPGGKSYAIADLIKRFRVSLPIMTRGR